MIAHNDPNARLTDEQRARVEKWIPLAWKIARRMRHTRLTVKFLGSVSDVANIGVIGLAKATINYKGDHISKSGRPVNFVTVAWVYVTREIMRATERNKKAPRPCTIGEEEACIFDYRRIGDRICRRNNVLYIGEDPRDHNDDIALMVKDIPDALRCLNQGDREVIETWFFSKDEHGDQWTLQALGDKLGLSKERIRQKKARGMRKILDLLRSRHPDLVPEVVACGA